jgi:tRNA(His) 5'-end guanylyltransferase
MKLRDRIKQYEKIFNQKALKRMPLIIRVDGRAFHTFTKGLNKPFDKDFMKSMVDAAMYTAKDMQGFKVAYVQSDEVTFCITDYDTFETEGWFGYELPKIISISAAMMSVAFNHYFKTDKLPVFDSRAFTVPRDEAVNVFVWRAKDWERNSLQMYSRSFFSNKQLHMKNSCLLHDMLHSVDRNWTTDLCDYERNGTFLLNSKAGIEVRSNILPTFENINGVIGKYFERTRETVIDLDQFA